MFKLSLASILKVFSRALRQLEELQKRNAEDVERNAARLREISEENEVLLNESRRAKEVADKIRTLIS